MKNIIFFLFLFLIQNICYSQVKKSKVGVSISDTIYRNKKNTIVFFNQTCDTMYSYISVSKKKENDYAVIPNILEYKKRRAIRLILTKMLPNSNRQYIIDNSVFLEYKINKGIYFFNIYVYTYLNNKRTLYFENTKEFYYK
jgi:hypothetical protein